MSSGIVELGVTDPVDRLEAAASTPPPALPSPAAPQPASGSPRHRRRRSGPHTKSHAVTSIRDVVQYASVGDVDVDRSGEVSLWVLRRY